MCKGTALGQSLIIVGEYVEKKKESNYCFLIIVLLYSWLACVDENAKED